ncbi:MAG: hypothetical protein Q4F81_03470, partial [Eubacteriales bacterium]|nr:hypothetical protein [Eubacteriales bacterium]
QSPKAVSQSPKMEQTPADRIKTARRGIFIFSFGCTGICTGSAAPFSAAARLNTAGHPPLSFSQISSQNNSFPAVLIPETKSKRARRFDGIRKLFFHGHSPPCGNHNARRV